jgi:excisionase family DNA binding protein
MDIMTVSSTAEVARTLGISKKTLLRWLYAGKLAEPKHQKSGGQDVRLWGEQDVARARRYKEENFRKGRGRKRK